MKPYISILFFLFLFLNALYPSVKKTVIEQSDTKLIIDIYIEALSEADLYPSSILVGLPTKELPITNIQYFEKTKIPFKSKHKLQEKFNWTNIQKLKNLNTGVLTVSPLSINNHYFKKTRITLEFKESSENYRNPNKSEITFLRNRIINWKTAKKWFIKKRSKK